MSEARTQRGRRGDLVVITGCDSGIGRSLAEVLRGRGYVVAASYLESNPFEGTPGVHARQLDLRRPSDIDGFIDFVKELTESGHTLATTVSNAGVALGMCLMVGELGSYALWREGATTLAPLRGTVDFAMAAGEGYYSASGQTTALSLSQPLLQVDFDRMQFSTRLSMVAANVPAAQLNVSGKINTEGVFLGKTVDQRVAGALNAQGTEAGYLFQLNAPTGVYNGLTLWTKK